MYINIILENFIIYILVLILVLNELVYSELVTRYIYVHT